MSRRISLTCTIKSQDILTEALEELGLDYHTPGPEVYRFRASRDGFSLMYGGLTLMRASGSDHFHGTFDEDCTKSRETLHLIVQTYMKRYYLEQAALQGDQILSCYVSDGHDQDPLIDRGDIVIHAVKG